MCTRGKPCETLSSILCAPDWEKMQHHVVEGLIDILHDPEIAIEVDVEGSQTSNGTKGNPSLTSTTNGASNVEGTTAVDDKEQQEDVPILFGNLFSSQHNAAKTLQLALQLDDELINVLVCL